MEPVAARILPSVPFRYSTASSTLFTLTTSPASSSESALLSLMYSAPVFSQASLICLVMLSAYGWVASTTMPIESSSITLAMPSAPPQLPTRTSMFRLGSMTTAPYSVATLTCTIMPSESSHSASSLPSVVPENIRMRFISNEPRCDFTGAHRHGHAVAGRLPEQEIVSARRLRRRALADAVHIRDGPDESGFGEVPFEGVELLR